MIETQGGVFVNLDNVFDIDIKPPTNRPHRDRHEVVATSPGMWFAANEYEPDFQQAVLFGGKEDDCVAYLKWLKKELAVPRGIIPFTFQLPSDMKTSEAWTTPTTEHLGDRVYWHRDGNVTSGKLVTIAADNTAEINWNNQEIHLPVADLFVPDDSTERDEVN